jgi:hypothetical protein
LIDINDPIQDDLKVLIDFVRTIIKHSKTTLKHPWDDPKTITHVVQTAIDHSTHPTIDSIMEHPENELGYATVNVERLAAVVHAGIVALRNEFQASYGPLSDKAEGKNGGDLSGTFGVPQD